MPLTSTAVCQWLQAMIPCSEVQKEAQPVDIPMSTIIDAPMQCLWDRINAWSTDYSWVQHAQVGREMSWIAAVKRSLRHPHQNARHLHVYGRCGVSSMHLVAWDFHLSLNRMLRHLQYITMPSERMPFLRVLHFNSTTVPVIRQTLPLPEPEQPDNGHRLIYYMLGGALLLPACTCKQAYCSSSAALKLPGVHSVFTMSA